MSASGDLIFTPRSFVRKPSMETMLRLFDSRVFGEVVLRRLPFPSQWVAQICPHPRQINSCGRGFGKSTGLITDNTIRRAVMMPYVGAMVNGLDKPLSYRAVLIANTKEQAFELQDGIRQGFDRHPWLRSLLSADTTKTNIKLMHDNGMFSRILIRPATAAARGQHAQTEMAKSGEVFRGFIDVLIDEGWFLRQDNFLESVVFPMFRTAERGSKFSVSSTPYGQAGSVWEVYSDKTTGRCMQSFTLDDRGRRVYSQFDPKKCLECVRKHTAVIHELPSWENPYGNERELYMERARLIASGRRAVWDQEYRAKPTTTAGLFFNVEHHRLMWNDNLPEFALRDDGSIVEWGIVGDDRHEQGGARETPIFDLAARLRRRGSRFFVGVDANQGIESKRQDFESIALVEEQADGMCYLRLCVRLSRPPRWFEGKEYKSSHLKQFSIVFSLWLAQLFDAKAFIDQGFGQGEFAAIQAARGDDQVEYIKTSERDKNLALLHLRGKIEQGKFEMPRIGFLVEECKYLAVEQDALDEDKVKIHKVAGYGVKGAQVDGIFAVAYAMRGAERSSIQVSGVVGTQMNMSGFERRGPWERRSLRVMGAR